MVWTTERWGKQAPISFISRTLHDTEQRYLRLALAVIFASRRSPVPSAAGFVRPGGFGCLLGDGTLRVQSFPRGCPELKGCFLCWSCLGGIPSKARLPFFILGCPSVSCLHLGFQVCNAHLLLFSRYARRTCMKESSRISVCRANTNLLRSLRATYL